MEDDNDEEGEEEDDDDAAAMKVSDSTRVIEHENEPDTSEQDRNRPANLRS